MTGQQPRPAASGFEVFTGGRPHQREAQIRLTQTTISLNASALDLLGRPATVDLLFDQLRRRIGIRAGVDGYHVSRSGTISASAYLKAYHLASATPSKWPVTLVEEMLIAEVSR
ncbi:hypothetical protein GCM10009616_36000 [Microlunatus lacustris]